MSDKGWAVMCHIGGFLGSSLFFLGNIIITFVLWIIKKDEPLVNRHGKSALNFQISISIYMFVLIGFSCVGFMIMGFGIESSPILLVVGLFLCVGGPLAIVALLIAEIVFVINASIKASNGDDYTYPLSINFIK